MSEVDRLGAIDRLVAELARLPGIGARTAQRLAHFIIRQSPQGGAFSLARDLADALLQVDEEVRLCAACRNFATDVLCHVCRNTRRDPKLLCVVESVSDLSAIERAGAFLGRYFVLHGTLSPLEGMGPEQLQLELLQERIAHDAVDEVILALNATLEGDTTSLYIAGQLAHTNVKLSRLASGVPHGGELEYLDRTTLGRALVERRAFAATRT